MRIDDSDQVAPSRRIDPEIERSIAEAKEIAARKGLVMIHGSDQECSPDLYMRYRGFPGVKAMAARASTMPGLIVRALFAPAAIAEVINQREQECVLARLVGKRRRNSWPLARLSDAQFRALFDDQICARCGGGVGFYCHCR